MNLFKKIIGFVIIILFTSTLMNTTQTHILASAGLNAGNKNIVNAAVLLYSYDDLFMLQLKQSLEELEIDNKDKIRFTFYDGKNNIAVQNETIDSIVQSGNVDIIIANLADISANYVENIILRVKPNNIPIIFLNVDQNAVPRITLLYNKAAFLVENDNEAADKQAQILIDLWNTDKKALDKNNDNILQYVLLRGEVDNPAAINRSKIVIDTLNNAGIQTQELALVNASWLKELAKNAVSNLFLRYNDSIEAIISNNDAMAIGSIEALQRYGYNTGDKIKKIAVVGIDALPEARELIDKELMTGTVIQDSKILAEVFYNVGMNLVNNLNPAENTDYKMIKGQIIIPFKYEPYTQMDKNNNINNKN